MSSKLKRFLSSLFCVAILVSLVATVPANAYSYNRVEVKPNMSRDECWIEAANYTSSTGLSRERIAVEMFGLSRAKLSIGDAAKLTSWGVCIGNYAGAAVCSVVTEGVGTPACLAAATKICATARGVAGAVQGIEYVVNLGNAAGDNKSYNISLGEASEKRLNEYYRLWYKNDDLTYIQSALGSKKVVDISGNSNKNGAKVQLWTKNGTTAQKFYFIETGEKTGDDVWLIIFKANTFKCLDVTGGKAEEGVNVQLWNYNGSEAQQWAVVGSGDSKYVYLKNRLGYYMDVQYSATSDGTQIWTWASNQTNAQKWKIS